MLKEIAGTRAYNILKKRKMETVEDVCQLFPSKYYDFSFINPLNTGRLDKNYAFVCKLVSYELKKQSSIYIVRCTLHDIYTQNELCVSWFGTTEMYNVLKKDYHPGDTCFIGGKLKASNKKNLFFMSNPIIFKKYDGESDCHIYTAYEKIRGISESNFERIINECLEHATIPDKVPRELLHKYNLMSKDEAIREMHKPSSVEGVKKAKYRLNIDDLLYFALQLEEKKRNLPAGSVYGIHSLAITTKIIKNLPFQLTKDQKSAYEELVNRIRSGKRLNALIQGDVGCGKTILAFLLMFVMADNGFQSVLLAPTQVLASQHYNELKEMAAQYNIDVVYIANGLKKKEREAILKSIEDGSALMIVGTHSVLSKEVKFHDLGLSITDEEHRFGVLQREEITTKAKAGMHTVTMSATPIPRSLSDVLLSTTEVFNIQSMPNGRKPVQTAICASQNTIFQFIKKEIEKGHQAYVVCPLIEDKQGVMEGILSVEQTYTEYTNIFGKNAVAVLNGKMNEDETEKVIRSFKNGEIKILVSTTVVEVGVNVSNATVIVINNAERFGLASLHQLRGRVGRGNSQGYCILNSVHKNNKRLLALCKYKNGFQIAESDYALRGSGNILGTEQSGSNYYVELSMKYPDLFSELQKYAKKYMDTGEAEMIVKTYQMSIKR
ncbi:ATP-dependent DNA helicase recG [Anaerobutyricum hallii]|uniref:ATP-dependent DNA helicase recG n=1 Tax=Anaerobutyricum hallii TaxID=39488 RepID=A0A173XC77_9FIRM|nr:ATP-dependent DNA helicase RecG [Anaerobutyricum hallii]GFO90307.1 ATP-dependent DNA helicase RecG [Anaerobutyricum hallii]CUN49244.1 ATP-dependent DNA helicase recG [Anaerobutyricum hallii]